jgi:hypothetical protein
MPGLGGYTYGDVDRAEWLARIYVDVDLTQSAATGLPTI